MGSLEPPVVREHSEHKVKYNNVIISLLALSVVPTYLYGIRVIILIIAAVSAAIVCDFFCVRVFLRSKRLKYDYSGIVTALVTALLLPATAPYWVAIISVAVGLCVAKYPFGGQGKNIFNPAAVGIAFSALSWPEHLLRYPLAQTTYGLGDTGSIIYSASLESTLRLGGVPQTDYYDIFLGKVPGPVGTTCIIVLACCMFFLLIRRVISKRIVLSALGTVAIFAALFPRAEIGVIPSVVYELSSGSLLFGIIFMAGDPVTTPDTKSGRIFYGVIIGVTAMLFRYFGKIELSFVYALLIANTLASSCDKYADFIKRHIDILPKKKKEVKKEFVEETDIEKVGEVNA